MVLFSWYSIVSITDGVISQRYGIGKTSYSERLFIDFTGRLEIYLIDLRKIIPYSSPLPDKTQRMRHDSVPYDTCWL